jgi:hypothetical protein
MSINLDEVLAKVKADADKLALIEKIQKANEAKLATLFPTQTLTATVQADMPETGLNYQLSKPVPKREQIAAFAKTFIQQHGASTTKTIVQAIEASDKASLLADRQNKVVAVSQALGELKNEFNSDRKLGWYLATEATKGESPTTGHSEALI